MQTIKKISVTASCFKSQGQLPERFLLALQQVLDSGGVIVSIVQDTARCKEAFVIVHLEPLTPLTNK
jgi:hypothetical protein